MSKFEVWLELYLTSAHAVSVALVLKCILGYIQYKAGRSSLYFVVLLVCQGFIVLIKPAEVGAKHKNNAP